MSRGYNGHKNWAHWNVSLWIGNDEGLCRMALEHIRRSRTRDIAAERMLDDLHSAGIRETPDGATYTKTSIRAAMTGLV